MPGPDRLSILKHFGRWSKEDFMLLMREIEAYMARLDRLNYSNVMLIGSSARLPAHCFY